MIGSVHYCTMSIISIFDCNTQLSKEKVNKADIYPDITYSESESETTEEYSETEYYEEGYDEYSDQENYEGEY